jgi:rod shape determining protein RodA
VAIGSGGLLGKGYGEGSQIQSNFVPYHHTDFIFSAIGEELGFIGAAGVLLLYMLFLLRAVRIALHAADLFGSLIVSGIVAMLLFQIFINVGMTIGIMPITGITMPLFSYGGTSVLITMLALGVILSVNMRSEVKLF